MNQNNSSNLAAEKLEAVTQTLEKEALFFESLIKSEESASVANKIILITVIFKTAATAIPAFLFKQAHDLFSYKPDETSVILKIFLEEIVRCARLSAYLCVKGVFPQAISVLRTAVELVGVYTHIWHEPRKIDYVEDSDSREYAQAFRFTSDKNLKKKLKDGKIKYRFQHCNQADMMSETYELLSGQFVHTASLYTIGQPYPKVDELSCYFIDSVSPKDLERDFNVIQKVLATIYLEIFSCLPEDYLMDEDIAALNIFTVTLLPVLALSEKELDPKLSNKIDEIFRELKSKNVEK